MADLLTRLEAASEGSRDLDEAIARAVYPELERGTKGDDRWYIHDIHVRIEAYTTSLDAKLPWENIVEMRYYIDPDGRDSAYTTIHEAEDGRLFEGKAKTEALARRIAALRARG